MSIEQELRALMISAMKDKDRRTSDVVKMLKSKVIERTKQKGFSGDVDDKLYVEVIGSYRKSMEKSVAEYEKAGERGAENAAQARWEADFCAQFLPQPLGEDELRTAVQAAIDELGATDVKMTGRIIGVVMKSHKGRTDAKSVKRVVAELLSS